MKKLIQFVILAIAISVSAFGQAKLPMIISSGHLRTYALTQAVEVEASVYSSSMIRSGYDYRKWIGVKKTEQIITELKSLALSGQSVSTSEPVSVYASIKNREGGQLFFAYSEAKPVLVNGSWTVPASTGNISLVLTDMPLPIDKEANYAVVIQKDPGGGYIYHDIVVINGKVMFPSRLAGLSDAFLRVDFADGTAVGYQLTTGDQLPVTVIKAALTPTFADVYSFENPALSIRIPVKSVGGVGVVPTVEISMSNAASVQLLTITEQSGVPLRYWLKSGTGAWTSVTGAAAFTTIPLPAGTTYIVPEWDPKVFREVNPLTSTGKGG